MKEGLISRIRNRRPLVHCISNAVTANDCANIALAIGASPIMADSPEEAWEITEKAQALVINLGMLTPEKAESSLACGRIANKNGIPIVLDPVGCGISGLRQGTVRNLLKHVRLSVIRGNASEITYLLQGKAFSGVDSLPKSEADLSGLQTLAKDTGAVIICTGEMDMVTDGENSLRIKNGHPMMGRITGSGCMCSTLIGCFCSTEQNPFDAALKAVTTAGIAGELAFVRAGALGTASFRTAFIDAVSILEDETREAMEKIEIL